MKEEEIKEILDYVNKYRYNKECKELVVEDVLTIEEAYELIDYITNLQQKVEQLENIIKEASEYITSHNPSDIGICGNDKKYYYTLDEDSVDYLLEILKGE